MQLYSEVLISAFLVCFCMVLLHVLWSHVYTPQAPALLHHMLSFFPRCFWVCKHVTALLGCMNTHCLARCGGMVKRRGSVSAVVVNARHRSIKETPDSQPKHFRSQQFQRKVWWFIPVPHRFIRLFVPSGSGGKNVHTAKFEMRLNSSPGISYLWQHQVARRALFPGAAMFETAYAAAITIAGITDIATMSVLKALQYQQAVFVQLIKWLM